MRPQHQRQQEPAECARARLLHAENEEFFDQLDGFLQCRRIRDVSLVDRNSRGEMMGNTWQSGLVGNYRSNVLLGEMPRESH